MSLYLHDLTYRLKRKELLKAVSCTAREGEVVGLIGPNGAGKSTLLKHLVGLIPSPLGTVMLDDVDLSRLKAAELARYIAYVSQFNTPSQATTLEVLELGRRAHSGIKLSRTDKRLIAQSVEQFNLLALLEMSVTELSGGERQKVMIASALLQEPKILLLDEPISHLDPKNQLEMLLAIHRLTREKGLITFIVLHDIQHAVHYTDRLLMLKQGTLLHDIETSHIEASMLEELFEVAASLHVSEGHTFVYYGHHHESIAQGHRH